MALPNNTHAASSATLGGMTFYTVTVANTVNFSNATVDSNLTTSYDRVVTLINNAAQPVVLNKISNTVVKFGADHNLPASFFQNAITASAEFANATVVKGL
jgi:hypothetical protein